MEIVIKHIINLILNLLKWAKVYICESKNRNDCFSYQMFNFFNF